LIPAPTKRRGSVAVALLAVLLALASCGGPASTGDGVPERIVSLVPTATETLFAIGAGDLVVGRCAYCDYPPEAVEIPAVADALSAGAERILALRPDLILVGSDAQARALGVLAERVPVERVIADDVAGVRRTIAMLGRITGHTREAEKLLGKIDRAFESAADQRVAGRATAVLFVIQHQPLRVAGGTSHITDLLTAVGAENVAADLDRPWPELSAESLVHRNPDIILDASLAPDADESTALAYWKRFESLSAVREGRVYRMDEPAVIRPGPRLPIALEYLSRIVRGKRR
jgi:iron complex transport system substrate-binding protein